MSFTLRSAAQSIAPALRQVSRRALVQQQQPLRRGLSSTPSASATYRRFGSPAAGQSSGSALVQLASRLGGRGGGGGKGGGRTNNNAPIFLVVAGAAGGGYYVLHLERVPATNRLRFIDVGAEQERAMGEEAYAQTMQENRRKILSPSSSEARRVQRVANRLIAALQETMAAQGQQKGGAVDNAKWEIHVIRSDEKNAYVLPGGKIFVYSGILDVCQNDDGLATVIGHEISHQLARHSAEKASGFKVLIVLSTLLEGLVGLDAGLTRAGLTLLMSLPNSRKLETEADYLGLQLMARACFDPREAPHLWERMQRAEGGGEGGGLADTAKALISTHPVNSQRIKALTKQLPEALAIREERGCPAPQQVQGFANAASNLGDWTPALPFTR